MAQVATLPQPEPTVSQAIRPAYLIVTQLYKAQNPKSDKAAEALQTWLDKTRATERPARGLDQVIKQMADLNEIFGVGTVHQWIRALTSLQGGEA